MNKRLIFLDAILLAVLALGVLKLREDWRAFAPAHQVSSIQPQPESFPVLPLNTGQAAGTPVDWTEIPSRNPFSFDRTDIAIPKPAAATGPTAGPKPFLFGTMNLGTGPIALMAAGKPGNLDSRPYRVGETIDGWTVMKIDKKSVVVESNSVQQTVLMNDPAVQIPSTPAMTPPIPAPGPTMAPSLTQPTAPQPTDEYEIQETPFGPRKIPKKKNE